jgi:hypothetical protein
MLDICKEPAFPAKRMERKFALAPNSGPHHNDRFSIINNQLSIENWLLVIVEDCGILAPAYSGAHEPSTPALPCPIPGSFRDCSPRFVTRNQRRGEFPPRRRVANRYYSLSARHVGGI